MSYERMIEAIRALLIAYPYHAILWSFYYSCKVFYEIKPCFGREKKIDTVCYPVLINDKFYKESMFIHNPNEVSDGFYVGKSMCIMIYDDTPYIIPKVWISQIYAKQELGKSNGKQIVTTWYLYRNAFCCRLNVIVEGQSSCMTRQSICIPSRVFTDIYHIGLDTDCQVKSYQTVYSSSYLVFGFKQIEKFLEESSRGRFKQYCCNQNAIMQALSKKGNCELMCHVLLCEKCYAFFDDVLGKFCSMYSYDDGEEVLSRVTDKCLHADLRFMISRTTCSLVKAWIEPTEIENWIDYEETLVD